tara:strand:+ start:286610 stop:287869 length:1260 start_codon:yes stop_codon:yes gene_type:complete
MQTLYVQYEGQLVGLLNRNQENIFSFAYDQNWLEHPQSFPICLVMPLTEETFGHKVTLAFFENLLPEGYVRDEIERSGRESGVFQLLKKYGKDCAGAISVSPELLSPNSTGEDDLVHVETEKIDTAIHQKRGVAELMTKEEWGYLSLAGAQDKFACIFKNNKFYIPQNGAPTTHIVKVPIWRNNIYESVLNEYFCMTLAKNIGLNTANVHIFTANNPMLIVERYDRDFPKKGSIKRLHQQDFCQAQGVWSEEKYEDKGGPTLQDNYNLIVENIRARKKLANAEDFLDWISFNLIIGNNDGHSKNLSLLLKDGIELAPFYDLISTAVYPALNPNFSFKLAGRSKADKIGINQMNEVETQLSIKPNTFVERFLTIAKSVRDEMSPLSERVLKEHPDSKVIPQIQKLIEKRLKGFAKQGLKA